VREACEADDWSGNGTARTEGKGKEGRKEKKGRREEEKNMGGKKGKGKV
jgi:hypothetical protein